MLLRKDSLINVLEVGEQDAHCYSFFCYGTKISSAGIIKNVPEKTQCCPDCKHILVWKSKSRRITRNTRIKRFSKPRTKIYDYA